MAPHGSVVCSTIPVYFPAICYESAFGPGAYYFHNNQLQLDLLHHIFLADFLV